MSATTYTTTSRRQPLRLGVPARWRLGRRLARLFLHRGWGLGDSSSRGRIAFLSGSVSVIGLRPGDLIGVRRADRAESGRTLLGGGRAGLTSELGLERRLAPWGVGGDAGRP
ncbi:MAG: hypothetical protein M3252_01895 [Actinomycetota bacterium]|nr:hypothetical protein [Actinomycetota bacterium]